MNLLVHRTNPVGGVSRIVLLAALAVAGVSPLALADHPDEGVPGNPPPCPTGLVAFVVGDDIHLRWDYPLTVEERRARAIHYAVTVPEFRIYRAEIGREVAAGDPAFPTLDGYVLVSVIDGDGPQTFVDTTALPGVSYRYVVTYWDALESRCFPRGDGGPTDRDGNGGGGGPGDGAPGGGAPGEGGGGGGAPDGATVVVTPIPVFPTPLVAAAAVAGGLGAFVWMRRRRA